MNGRWITAARWKQCARCAGNIFKGRRFLWFGRERLAFCETCGEASERDRQAAEDLFSRGGSAPGAMPDL